MEAVGKPVDTYRFVTFNVCGIKSFLSRCSQWVPERSYSSMFERLSADVICFQETKIQPDGIDKDMAIVPGFNSFFTCSIKPRGYSGVSFHVRNTIRVLKAEEGLTGWLTSTPGGTAYRERESNLGTDIYPDISQSEGLEIDAQGRSITLDLGVCIVIGLYCPADSSGNMTDYRDLFYQLLDWRIIQLRKSGHQVIVLGDLNAAREPIDSATLREALRKAKMPIDDQSWKYGTVPRKALNNWIEELGFHDTTREAHPHHSTMFTCWDQSKNARPANFGSRIDYVLTSEKIQCAGANIMSDLVGSDHCPVYADLYLKGIEPQDGHRLPILSRKHTSKWQGGVMAFFSSNKAQKTIAPVKNEEKAKQGDNDNNERPKQADEVSSPPTVPNSPEPPLKTLCPQKTTPKQVDLVKSSLSSLTPLPNLPRSPCKPPSSGVDKRSATRQGSLSKFFASKSTEWARVNERKPPLCTHNEPCVLKMSKKPPRKGEYFWHCARPHGGTSNADGKYQCKTFIWDSELRQQFHNH